MQARLEQYQAINISMLWPPMGPSAGIACLILDCLPRRSALCKQPHNYSDEAVTQSVPHLCQHLDRQAKLLPCLLL